MMKLLKRLLPAMLAGLLAANAAHAASGIWTEITSDKWTNVTSSGATLYLDATTPLSFTADSLASDVWYFNANPSHNSLDGMAAAIDTQFSLSGSSLVKNVSSCDGGCGMSYSSASFNYLAVHFGGGELLFQWSKPVSTFAITSGLTAVSNFRAYTNATAPNVPAVPEPETYAMMLAGILGVMALRLRRLGA